MIKVGFYMGIVLVLYGCSGKHIFQERASNCEATIEFKCECDCDEDVLSETAQKARAILN